MLKKYLYRFLLNAVFPLLGNDYGSLRFKWFITIQLIGLEFHKQNIKENASSLENYIHKEYPLIKIIAEKLKTIDRKEIRLLDVGSGPFSKSGNYIKDKNINKTLFDPLAKKYIRLLKKHHVPANGDNIVNGTAEKIDEYFKTNFFDIIYSKNSLDHSYNPFLALKKMLAVLKENGFIILEHYIKEGEYTNYYGLHQWNFFIENADFCISNKDNSIFINVNRELSSLTHIETAYKDEKVICIIQKV